jgi:lysozyme
VEREQEAAVSREVNHAGFALVRAFEGLGDGDPSTVALDPYLCPAGVWTIGWGHAIRRAGRLLRGERDRRLARSLYPAGITRGQAEALLRADLLDAARDVAALLGECPVTDNEFAALASFHFNTGALGRSTLLRRLLAGDRAGAAAEFPRWNRSGGRVLRGLTRRRLAERELFLT